MIIGLWITHKTNEALVSAHELTLSNGHVQITPLHVAATWVGESGGIFRQAVSRVGGSEENADSVDRVFKRAIKNLPS